MNIKIINTSGQSNPEYSTEQSAGMDVKAFLDQDIIIKPLQRILVPTGLFIELPDGYEAQIRPRSGLAIKEGITVLNTPGTIDADYRGEIKIILINLSDKDFIIKNGDRIAQMIVSSYEKVNWINVEKINHTERNFGGFGHTGKN